MLYEKKTTGKNTDCCRSSSHMLTTGDRVEWDEKDEFGRIKIYAAVCGDEFAMKKSTLANFRLENVVRKGTGEPEPDLEGRGRFLEICGRVVGRGKE